MKPAEIVETVIVPETKKHVQAVHDINAAAFKREAEAELVAALRSSPGTISLVAKTKKTVTGHILFSPMTREGGDATGLMSLSTLAVAPHLQRQGIGSLLVSAGLRYCFEAGHQGLVVIGHPTYYPRFGFRPAAGWDIRTQFEVPEDVFMALALKDGGLAPYTGATLAYHPAFAGM
ncbi:GNAT family N-acetyltransferase [Desulfoluna spongiiphila]|uniref:GNAT family N-acetyltransferase n=1 Tax=Desulfoluna spongiiphila TaxID=419481 RepID=UPI0012590CFE|nr:N-acetyltransferase [Desulfoluna spongiiphila]VVS91992.1 acyl-coa n-acyltransferase [Desulfoluna spongiiphila]